MARRIVDPRKFLLLGSVTDWVRIARQQGGRLESPYELAERRRLSSPRMLQLRWVLAQELGYPSAPFTVWRRPSSNRGGEIGWRVVRLLSQDVVMLDRPCCDVYLRLAGPGGAAVAFSGMPHGSAMSTPQEVEEGTQTVNFTGTAIGSVVLPEETSVEGVWATDAAIAEAKGWEPLEKVGLPVDERFDGVLRLDEEQGLVAEPTDPVSAALDRYRRGAPFYGWGEEMEPGVPAPLWEPADPKAMVQAVHDHMLDPFLRMVETLPAAEHHNCSVSHTLPASGSTAEASFGVLSTLVYGAATDPPASLIAGFGTAYEQSERSSAHSVPGVSGAGWVTPADPYDYMVTATYDSGTLGTDKEVEYAALLLHPRGYPAPPPPTGMSVESDGLQSPAVPDGPWRSVHRVGWDRVPDALPFRIGSYALARQATAPQAPVEALMDPRLYDTALQPIGATIGPDPRRLSALDDRYDVTATPNPNSLLYGVAMQDLFGIWSPWTTAPFEVGEPAAGRATIVAAWLETEAASGKCPGTVVLDLAWNWANRTPERIDVVGRPFPQALPGEVPSSLAMPPPPPASLFVTLRFDADGTATANAGAGMQASSVEYLSSDGKDLLTSPPQDHGPRRYRVIVTGLKLDFDASGAIGMGFWARGVERRPPSREGPWSAEPVVASAADPRPPVISVEHEDVLLTSMADAAGEHHAKLSWTAAPGATGYVVYTTTESKLRADRGAPAPPASQTLSERLAGLRMLFAANPDRRSFTRVTPDPVRDTSLAIKLPRGTKEIHLFVVLGISAGNIESSWPSHSDPQPPRRPIAYAAPQVVRPNPPELEVAEVLDRSTEPPQHRAEVRLRTAPGAAVGRVDLHRVRVPDAAAELEEMGPPVAEISGTTSRFAVTPRSSAVSGESQAIGRVCGRDSVEGSWRRVFYRAVAWGRDDPSRGLYAGRSAPSALRSVVVPPAGPPDLGAPGYVLPVAGSAAVRVDVTTLAPVAETPLGPHRFEAEVLVVAPDGTTETLLAHPEPATNPEAADPEAGRLDRLPTAVPASAGAWREEGAGGATLIHLLVPRASFDDALRVRLRVGDPLGRIAEQMLEVPAGLPTVAPDLLAPQLNAVASGWILAFVTSVPDEVPGAGPYCLAVRFRPAGILPGGRAGRGTEVETELAELAVLEPGEDLLADREAAIPVRRTQRTEGRTLIAIGLRERGLVNVTLTGPDGTSTELTRRVG